MDLSADGRALTVAISVSQRWTVAATIFFQFRRGDRSGSGSNRLLCFFGCMIEKIQRGVSSQRFALNVLQYPILPEWIALAANQSIDGTKPQIVVIIEIFVAEDQAFIRWLKSS
jgi:hypothetical protein